MKKGILSFAIGMLIAFSVFWLGQPTASENVTVSDLPKKEFAKAPIELPTNAAWTSATVEMNADKRVQSFTIVKTPDKEKPTKEDFMKIAHTFMEEIVQPTDNNYKVNAFDSKNELINHLSQYASEHIATYYVEELYEERNGELFIIPTESPPWIVMGEPSNLSKTDEQNYQLTQTNHTDLYGDYKIQLSFTSKDGNWIIADVKMT